MHATGTGSLSCHADVCWKSCFAAPSLGAEADSARSGAAFLRPAGKLTTQAGRPLSDDGLYRMSPRLSTCGLADMHLRGSLPSLDEVMVRGNPTTY